MTPNSLRIRVDFKYIGNDGELHRTHLIADTRILADLELERMKETHNNVTLIAYQHVD